MEKEKLQEILQEHQKWLDSEGGKRANLRGADLWAANLRGADLCEANLREANLRGANLCEANLRGANLCEADLWAADLCEANLREANLRGANLWEANLRGAKLPHFQICPEEGDFIAWKKTTGGVCKLLIPADAKRTSSLVGRKCRASHVKVLEGSGVSKTHETKLEYKAGKIVRADKYCDDIRIECSNGIHFFMTRKEAEEWQQGCF